MGTVELVSPHVGTTPPLPTRARAPNKTTVGIRERAHSSNPREDDPWVGARSLGAAPQPEGGEGHPWGGDDPTARDTGLYLKMPSVWSPLSASTSSERRVCTQGSCRSG